MNTSESRVRERTRRRTKGPDPVRNVGFLLQVYLCLAACGGNNTPWSISGILLLSQERKHFARQQLALKLSRSRRCYHRVPYRLCIVVAAILSPFSNVGI